MELAFDHQGLNRAAQFDLAGDLNPGLPDWAGIKARFLAAHALRRELAAGGSLVAGGSFTDESAHVLAAQRESSLPVNLTASANGKTPFAMENQIAGNPCPASEE